jgi:hypothetical protein
MHLSPGYQQLIPDGDTVTTGTKRFRTKRGVNPLMRMPSEIARFLSVTAGNPAFLEYAKRAIPSDCVDASYAMILPSMTILMIVCAQLATGVSGGP